MKRETYDKNTKINVIEKQNKSIILFIDEAKYASMIVDNRLFKNYLKQQIKEHPELFPEIIQKEKWSLNGYVPESKKQNVKMRRIISADKEVWQIHPSFLMPYSTCKTEEASKYLFLLNWCPYWALAYVYGKDAMFYYRLQSHFGMYNMVGTTAKKVAIPVHLSADEKHGTISGEKVYAAITCGGDCFLGASISPSASEEDLTLAYGQFKAEATDVSPTYQAETVNTDGWFATIGAWRALFVQIVVIQCFLHAILKIKSVATKSTQELYNTIVEKAWDAYHAPTKQAFSQRIRRISEYAKKLSESKIKAALQKLCSKRAWFTPAYDYNKAHRTSNMVDRLINRVDRRLTTGKWWRGSIASAEKNLRAFCLIQNFCPYCPWVQKKYNGKASASERLNNHKYCDNWLENLLIATSVQTKYIFQQNPI